SATVTLSYRHKMKNMCNYEDHLLVLDIPLNFPIGAVSLEASLPIPFNPKWKPNVSTIGDVYEAFIQAVSSCQQFWSMMDNLDSRWCVLDPEIGRASCRERV